MVDRLEQDMSFYDVVDGKMVLPEGMDEEQARVLKARAAAEKYYRETGDKSKMIEVGLFPASNTHIRKARQVIDRIRELDV